MRMHQPKQPTNPETEMLNHVNYRNAESHADDIYEAVMNAYDAAGRDYDYGQTLPAPAAEEAYRDAMDMIAAGWSAEEATRQAGRNLRAYSRFREITKLATLYKNDGEEEQARWERTHRRGLVYDGRNGETEREYDIYMEAYLEELRRF